MNYDSKNYDFATTINPVPGKTDPPDGDRWTFVEMKLSEKLPLQAIVLWTRIKRH